MHNIDAIMTPRQIAYWAPRADDEELRRMLRLAEVPGLDVAEGAKLVASLHAALDGDVAARAAWARRSASTERKSRETPAAFARRVRSFTTWQRGWAAARPIVRMILRDADPVARRRLIRQLDRRGSLTRPDEGMDFEGWIGVAKSRWAAEVVP